MKIEIRNLPEVKSMLGNLANEQLPFAMSVTINRTLFKLLDKSKEIIKTKFDRPTPGIQKSTRVTRATKKNFSAKISIAEDRLPVLNVHERGITRGRIAFETKLKLPLNWYAVPTKNIPLNQYGNPNRTIKNQIIRARSLGNRGRKQYLFVMVGESGFDIIRGRLSPGIYESKTGSNELVKLFHFVKRIEYRPILKWEETLEKEAKNILPGITKDAVELAIKTAR